MSEWVSSYIGVPFVPRGRDRSGLDCWGLVRLVYSEQLGVTLRDLDGYVTSRERNAIDGLVNLEASNGLWTKVSLTESRAFDVAVFRLRNLQCHLGVLLDRRTMLHATEGKLSACERIFEGTEWATRLHSIYRHVSQAA